MSELPLRDLVPHNGVLNIDRTFARSKLAAEEIIGHSLRLAKSESLSQVIVKGIVVEENEGWIRCRLPFALVFEDCTFSDGVRLDHAEFEGVFFNKCRFSLQGSLGADSRLTTVGAVVRGDLCIRESDVGCVDLREALIHGNVTLEKLCNISSVRLDRLRADGDVVLQNLHECEPTSCPPGKVSNPTSLVWGTSLRSLVARSINIRDSRFCRGVNIYAARAESVTLERCKIGTARLNTYVVPAFPTLGNSIVGGEATLLMSSIEATSVQVGSGVWVGGDVRMLNLVAKSLRVGTDDNWLSRVNGVPTEQSALTIDGGIFNAKDARSQRTEIQLVSSSGQTPSMLLNDANLGDLSLYHLAIGGNNGHICLYGTAYSNFDLKAFKVDPGGLLFPRHRGDIDLPGLLVVRDFAHAHRLAPPGPLEDRDTDEDQERERTSFRGQPYLALASHLGVTGDSRGAREVMICMQDDKRRLSAMPWPSKMWNWISGFTVKHGYSVQRTVLPLILMILIAGLVVHLGSINNSFTATQTGLIADNALIRGESPTGPLAQDALLSSECSRLYPCMETVSYTINMLLPFGNFTQVSYWQPSPEWAWRHLLTGLVAGVWIATTILVAALTGIARRSPES